MSEFKREERYIIIKVSDIEEALFPGERDTLKELAAKVQHCNQDNFGKEYVVVSNSNRELFDYVWKEIEAQWLKDSGKWLEATTKRVSNEKGKLDDKIYRLAAYLNSEYSLKISPPARERLLQQIKVMQEYSGILHTRLMGDLLPHVEGLPVSFENQKEQ